MRGARYVRLIPRTLRSGSEQGDQFTSNLGPRWTGSYHTKEGFQVSKGKWKRSKGNWKGELERGNKKQGDCVIVVLSIYIHVHIGGRPTR